MNDGKGPGERWWLDPGLARLAFGSEPGRAAGARPQATHLAFLPPEALELDLSDPAQSELGDYQLQELVGQGGMGVVYRAWQKTLEREVALKLLSAGPWASDEFIASFRREARNAAGLQHPNIVAVYEMGEQDGLIFYVMQLVRGESLAETLRRRHTLPAQEAAGLLRTIAEAVDYAHRMGVLHLDLKPGNVLLDSRGEALVTDFGLARRLGQAPSVENEQVSGTPSYMAPEQAQVRSSRLSAATDIWGMGAILYEMLTGVPPFTGSDPHEILGNVLNGTVRRLSRHARIPADLEAICLRCLRKEPGERYPTARALADDLGRFLEHRSVQARPLNRWQRIGRWAEREPRLAAVSAMAVAALVTGLVTTTHQWGRAEEHARVASERLWEGRREAALQLEAEGEGWEAARRLLQNIEEQQAAGGDAEGDRLRLGLLLGQGARLVDAGLVADATPLAVAMAPDGQEFAIAFGDRSVRWYDGASLRERGRIDLGERRSSGGELRATVRLRYAGSRHLLATQEWYRTLPNPTDGDTWLLDLEQGRLVEPPAAFTGFSDAAFSDDGRIALLRDREGRVQAWRTAPWEPLSPRVAPTGDGRNLAWRLSRDGRLGLALDRDQRRLQVLRLDTLAVARELVLPHGARVTAWTFDPGGTRVALGDDEGRLYVFDLPDGALRALPSARGREVTWVDFSEDGAWLVSAATDGRAHAFDAASGDPLVSGSMDHGFALSHVGVDRHQRLVVASGQGQRALWRLPAMEGPRALAPIRIGLPPAPHDAAGPFAQAWNREGLLVSAGHEGALRLWRLPAGPFLPASLARQVAEQPSFDAGRVVDVSWDRVRIMDGRGDAGPWLRLPGPPGFSELGPDARWIVSIVGNQLHRHHAGSLEPVGPPLALPATPQRFLFHPDGRRVLLVFPARSHAGFAERLLLLDLEAGAALPGEATLDGPLLQLGWLDGGRRLLAVGPAEGATVVFSTEGLEKLGEWAHDPFEPVVSASAIPGQSGLWLLTRAPDPRLGRDSLRRWHPGDEDAALVRELPNRPFAVAGLANGRAFVAGEGSHAIVAADGGLRPVARQADASDASLGALAARGDGQMVAVSGRHGVQLHDVAGVPVGRTLGLGAPPLDGIFDLAFVDEGRRLFARTVHSAARWPVVAADMDPALAGQLDWLATSRHASTLLTLPTDAERRLLRGGDPGPWLAATQRPAPALAGHGHDDGSPIPARSADTPATALDLTGVYAVGPDAVRNSASAVKPFLRPWPAGRQHIGGVDFDIRGMADVGAAGLGQCVPVPDPQVQAAHVLALPSLPSPETRPRALAELVFHYADGGTATLPLRATRELQGYGGRDHLVPLAFTARAPRSAMGFTTTVAAAPRLPNPHPDRPVRCLDLRGTSGSLLLFALSVSPPVAAVTEPVISAR